jgi:hypothetical protein
MRSFEQSLPGTEYSPIAPFTTKAVIKIIGDLLIGWIPNSDPAAATPLAKGQSDHYLIGKLVPTTGGFIGKFVGENTTVQPNNNGRFIMKDYVDAHKPLLYESGVAVPARLHFKPTDTLNYLPTAKFIL